MGIHTGRAGRPGRQATPASASTGPRGSAAVGHGGQIVVSQATRILLDDEEEVPGVSLLDLGERRLKDFDQPVRLYQVEADGLPAAFPDVTAPRAERPLWRRPVLVAATLVAAVTAVGVGLAVVAGSGGSRPGHVVVIDPETSSVAGSVPTGREPGPVTSGAGSIWVGNLGDRTVTRINAVRRIRTATVSLEGRSPTGLDYRAGALWVAHGLRGQLWKGGAFERTGREDRQPRPTRARREDRSTRP